MNLKDVAPAESGPRKLPAVGVFHPAKIIFAEAATSSAGNAMVKIQAQLTEEEAEGYILYDNFLTDGSAKGAGFTIPKLQGLGINTDEEISDDELAERLLNLEFFVEVKHEPIKDQDPRTGKYTLPRYEPDAVTGRNAVVRRAVAKRYSLSSSGGQAQTTSAPQGAPPAPGYWQQPSQPAQRGPTSGQMQTQADAFPRPPVQAPPPQPGAAVPPWMQQGAGAPPPPQPVKNDAGATGGKGRGKAK